MNRARLLSLVLAPSLLVAAISAARGAETAPQRYALLIGVNSYTHLSDLHFCENDMRALREACVAAGFPEKNVTFMHKSSDRPELIPVKNHVMEQLKILLKGVQPNDLVLVAFSGHGVHVGDKDYFCTIDAKLEDPQGTMVPAAEVTDMLDKSPARQQVMIIDACRNDPLPEGTRSASSPSVATAFTRSVKSKDNASHGLMVMRSCDEQQVSVEDPSLQHGVFMNFVVNGLLGHADANRNKQVTLLELYQYAEYETRNHVRVTRSMLQTPSMKGDFAGNYIMAEVSGRPLTLDLQPVSSTGGASKGPSTLEMKLYDEAYALFQQGKTKEAITAFEQMIRVVEDEQLKKVARLKLATAYQEADPLAYIAKALELHKEAGLDSISMVVEVPTANVMLGPKALVSVKATQMVGISSVDGEWYLAESVDGYPLNADERGYLHKSAFQRPAPKPAVAGQPAQVASSGGYGYGYGNSGGLRSASGGNSSVADYQRELDYYDHPADKAQVTQLRQGLNQLDRMEQRGASEMAIRAKERELYRQADQLEKKEATREAIRSFFRGD